MASLKKRGRAYYIRFSKLENGKRIYKTFGLGTNWKEVAIKKKRELEVLQDKREIDPFNPDFSIDLALYDDPRVIIPSTLGQAFDLFLLSKNYTRLATITAYKNNVEHFMDYTHTKAMHPTNVTVNHGKKFLLRDGISPVSAGTNKKHLTTFFNFMVAAEWITKNPFDTIDLPKVELNYHDKMLTDIEFKKLFKVFDAWHKKQIYPSHLAEQYRQLWFKPMIALYYYTGLRLSEGAYSKHVDYSGLKGANFLHDYNLIYLPKTKGKKERFIPISKYLRPYLIDYIKYRGEPGPDEYLFVNRKGRYKGAPIAGKTVREAFNFYLAKAKIPATRTIHGLRHARITNWIEQGLTLSEAAAMAGHSSTKVTEGTYTHLAVQKLMDKFRALEDGE